MINHVYRAAEKISPGNAYVVTGDIEIYNDVVNSSGKSILTKKNHKTGTDRIYEGFKKINDPSYKYILNLQGDEPLVNIKDVKKLIACVTKKNLEIGTLACKLQDSSFLKNQNIVKVLTDSEFKGKELTMAKKFERISGNKINSKIFHHVGVYIYRADILKKITSLKQSVD